MINKNSTRLKATANAKKVVNPKIGILIAILIVLQFYLLPYFYSITGPGNQYEYLSISISYSIIVLSIIIYQGQGLRVLQDRFSLWLIVLACLFSIALGGKNVEIYQGYLFFLSVVLSIFIIKNRKDIPIPGTKTTLIGLFWSIIAVVILALIYALLDQTYTKPFPPNLFAIIIHEFISQFTLVAVIEEAYFRGLLFSYMTMNGFDENTALFIQAILFWGVHYWKINNPTLFFIIIPLGIVFITLIIKKYKMLYLSIMMHTFINVFLTLLVTVINRNLF